LRIEAAMASATNCASPSLAFCQMKYRLSLEEMNDEISLSSGFSIRHGKFEFVSRSESNSTLRERTSSEPLITQLANFHD